MNVKNLFDRYSDVIYFSWFDYITDKHLSLLIDYKSKITVLNGAEIGLIDLSQYDPRTTLLLAQTSCKTTNLFFSNEKLKPFGKALIQDGFRLIRRNSIKFKFALILDKLNSRFFHFIETTYYKKLYDFYIVTTELGRKEAEIYGLPKDKVVYCRNNKKSLAINYDKIDKGKIILIDQPLEIYFQLDTQSIYKKIYNSFKAPLKDSVYVKPHPSLAYDLEYRRDFRMYDGGLEENYIYITFYSTLGLELLQQGRVVFFLVEFIPNEFIWESDNFFILKNMPELYERIGLVNANDVEHLNSERDKLIEEVF